ncbi:MAG: sugar phosphate nucleotidyltransferase [Candidatus Levyibacteriota bacterium]|jgi:glucose-1-phosphate thymidylyltransferase
MKGIILAGGRATRLRPLTKITSKQLLPIYNKPMIYYPIQTLVKAGISDILIIVAPEYSGQFLNLLGSGNELGANLSYEVQEEPRGLPDAFIVGENFIEKDNVAMILGDNIFDHNFAESVTSFKSGARIFAKQVPDPERSGVVEFDQDHKVISIVEKPEHPKSNYAVVGFYIYDNRVIEYAKSLRPSARNELEIVDLHNKYLKNGELKVDIIEGMWEDAGTFDSLLRVNNLIAERVKQGGVI